MIGAVRKIAPLVAILALAACDPLLSKVGEKVEADTVSGPPILQGPGESVQCQNGAGPVFDDPDGNLTLFKWCPSSTVAGYAHRDRYTRPNAGAPWMFRDNYLFNCSSQKPFIISRIGLNGYNGVCP